jgi:hypothetical protein
VHHDGVCQPASTAQHAGHTPVRVIVCGRARRRGRAPSPPLLLLLLPLRGSVAATGCA